MSKSPDVNAAWLRYATPGERAELTAMTAKIESMGEDLKTLKYCRALLIGKVRRRV